MPQLGECLSHLDAKAVNDHVFLVLVRRKEFCGLNADCLTHGDDMESRVVGAVILKRPAERSLEKSLGCLKVPRGELDVVDLLVFAHVSPGVSMRWDSVLRRN